RLFLLRSGLLLRGRFLGGVGLLLVVLLLGRALDELEDRHLGGVAAAGAELHDARVAARARRETRAEGVEQLRDERVIGNAARGLTAIVHAVVFRERDQLLEDRTKLFRLRKRGDDPLAFDQRRQLVAEHRIAMARRTSQLAVCHSMSHQVLLLRLLVHDYSRYSPRAPAGTR